jgi:mRNA deadenylase 3'-5' endonuclease subunit Ccr4
MVPLGIVIIILAIVIYLYYYWKSESSDGNELNKIKRLSLENKFISVNIPTGKQKVSIVTYNILCHKYVHKKRKELNLDFRMNIIIAELESLNSDIICLQEVNSNTYKKYLLPNLIDYKFIYLTENYGSNFINLIGYKYKKLEVVGQSFIDLINIDVEGNRGVFQAIFKIKSTNILISVFNVHFPWRPRYEMEKCYVLNAICEKILKDNLTHVLLVGDFNSLPNSFVMRLIYFKKFLKECNLYKFDGSVSENNIEQFIESKMLVLIKESTRTKHEKHIFEQFYANLTWDFDKENRKFIEIFQNFAKLSQRFNLKSSYDRCLHSTDDEAFLTRHPKYTNYTENFKATIDYIFFSNKLMPIRILELPDLSREDFIPSVRYPSDHLKLYTEFEIV